MEKINILLVDDHTIVRDGIKATLKDQTNFVIVGEAFIGVEAIEAVKQLNPDVVVMDITMPEMNGIDLCLKIKSDKRTTHIPVILLTAIAGEEQQLKGLGTGASDIRD